MIIFLVVLGFIVVGVGGSYLSHLSKKNEEKRSIKTILLFALVFIILVIIMSAIAVAKQ